MELKKQYDVAIIGGGIGGIMTAYRLTEKKPELNVVILEKGHDIEKRICPIVAKKQTNVLNANLVQLWKVWQAQALFLMENM